jgi:hypothetical protein
MYLIHAAVFTSIFQTGILSQKTTLRYGDLVISS